MKPKSSLGVTVVKEDNMAVNEKLVEKNMHENMPVKKFNDLVSEFDWQYLHLYKFIVKYVHVPKGKKNKKISLAEQVAQDVLVDYLSLLEKFYTQFRSELKKEYENNSELVNNVPALMQEALDKLVGEWERVYGFISINPESDTDGIQSFLEKLNNQVINAAIRDVGFNPDIVSVVPQFGNAYSLGFFNYSDDFMALNVPLTKVKSPWEWTIFWHEIAGLRVRLLKKTCVEYQNLLEELFVEIKRDSDDDLISKIRDVQNRPDKFDPYTGGLAEIFEACEFILMLAGFEATLKDDANSGSFDNDSTYKRDLWQANAVDLLRYLENNDLSLTETRKFFKDQNRRMLMFSFDDFLPEIMADFRAYQEETVIHQLQISLANEVKNIRKDTNQGDNTLSLVDALKKSLNLNEDFTARKKKLDDAGWSNDWLEELFEDSFSVMNFNLEFLELFDKVLNRYRRRDQRHPPHDVRMAVALSLKLLTYDSSLQESMTLPEMPQWPQWNLTMGLNNKNEYESLSRFYNNLQDDKEFVWLVAKRIWGLYKWSDVQYNDGDEKKAIADAMKDFRTKKSGKWEEIANNAFDFLQELKLESTNVNDLNLGADKIDNDTYVIENLLSRKRLHPEPLSYRELLELPFYDEDFGTLVPTYSFTYGSRTYFITATNLATAVNSNFIFSSKPTNMLTDQITINNISYWTTSANIDAMKDSSRRLL